MTTPVQILRASFDTEVKTEGERALGFTISTASIDRMGDVIRQDGWQLDNYRKNPVVLWAHDASMLPVGKANSITADGASLKSTVEFTPAGMSKFNDTVFGMYKGGFLSATSVGFAPIEFAPSTDPERKYGVDFIKQELLEFSLVPVPANAEALIEARSAGLDMAPLIETYVAQIKKFGAVEALLEIRKALTADDLVAFAQLVLEEAKANPKAADTEIAMREFKRRQRERELNLIRLRMPPAA